MPSHRYGIGFSSLRPISAPSRRVQRRWAALCLAAGAVSLGHFARATTDNWIGGSSNWNNPANWNTNTVPADSDTVNIDTADLNVDFIDYDYPGPAVTLGSLTINNSGGGNDVFTMQTAGLVLSSGPETIGGTGSANFDQTAGFNSAASLLVTGTAAYSLDTGATLSSSGGETIDYGASFDQHDGNNSLAGSLVIGSQPDSTAGYSLLNGTLTTGFAIYAGLTGTGTFSQTGGSASATNFEIGFLSTASGEYFLSGTGSLSITGNELVGYLGSGSVVQTGGNASIGAGLVLAVNANASGSYTQSDGTLTAQNEFVGNAGSATFIQTGGMNSVGDTLYLGYLGGSSGAFTLGDPATLSVTGSEFVGYGNDSPSNGSFTQLGGLNTLTGTFSSLSIASGAGTNGSYSLSDGTLSLTGAGSVEQIGLFGTATFLQTGGTNNAAGLGENIGVFNGSQAVYNQSGGVNQLGLVFTNLSLGYSAGATGTYNITGGTLSAANIYVGGSPGSSGGAGNLNISGPSQVIAAGSLVLYNTASSIQVNGGSLLAASAMINGPYTQTAGTAVFGQLNSTGQINLTGGVTRLAPGGGTSSVTSLTINGGTFDLTNNSLAINYTPGNDPVATVVSYLRSGYKGGAWTGAGLTSSTAAANPRASIGYVDATDNGGQPNQLLLKYTLAGDANLDGVVNFSDLVTVIQNFNKAGRDWSQGNFSYDPNGIVNFFDLVIVVQNFNRVLSNSGSGGISGLSAPVQIQNTSVQLPEPGAAALAVSAAALLARRRRRNRDRI